MCVHTSPSLLTSLLTSSFLYLCRAIASHGVPLLLPVPPQLEVLELTGTDPASLLDLLAHQHSQVGALCFALLLFLCTR